jgi:hypothetical protein
MVKTLYCQQNSHRAIGFGYVHFKSKKPLMENCLDIH